MRWDEIYLQLFHSAAAELTRLLSTSDPRCHSEIECHQRLRPKTPIEMHSKVPSFCYETSSLRFRCFTFNKQKLTDERKQKKSTTRDFFATAERRFALLQPTNEPNQTDERQ